MPGTSRKKDLAAERKNLETSSDVYWLAGTGLQRSWCGSADRRRKQTDGED
jgi:hypothetical protein